MKRGLFLLLFCSISIIASSQDSNIGYENFLGNHKNRNNLLSLSDSSLANDNKPIKISGKKFYPEIAINYNLDGFTSFEFGLYTGYFAWSFEPEKPPSIMGGASSYTLDVYSDFSDKVIIGPKYSFMFFIAFVDFGISAAGYTDFEHLGLFVRPFAGFSFLGKISLNIGYNFDIIGYSFKEIDFYNIQLKYRF